MELGQTQQIVEDLHFSLYQRALHPELFHIYQVKRVEHRRYNAEIWVTGLAHVVTVQFGDQNLTELVSEQSDLLPRVGLAHSFRFRGERDYSQTFPGGLHYILSSQVERMSPNLFPSTHRDLVRYGQRRGMYMMFDEWGHEGLMPLTFIDFEPRERELHIHAYHVFPAERTILKTQSIFEKEPETPWRSDR
ncbi:MAG: DUF2617 family protein [Phycisphaerae bacterium]